MQQSILQRLFSISLKARVLRAWQEANEGGRRVLSDRDVLALELVEGFAHYSPITETDIAKVLGLSPSSANDLVSKLSKLKLLMKESDEKGHTRSRPLQVTKRGREELSRMRRAGAARYAYLFTEFSSDEEWAAVQSFLDKIDVAATRAVRKHVFGQYELDFEDRDTKTSQ